MSPQIITRTRSLPCLVSTQDSATEGRSVGRTRGVIRGGRLRCLVKKRLASSRFQQHFVDLQSLRLHYAEVPGPGRPLLLLHGIGMDWRVWQGVARRLEPFFHLYLVDLRGHGDSEKPAHGYSVPHYAADIEDFIDELHLEGAVLVGSSLGGMVTAAVEAPTDVVAYRVLVDPPLTGGPASDLEMFRRILELKHGPVRALTDYLAAFNPHTSSFLLQTMSEMWHEASDGVIEDVLEHPEDYNDVDAALRLDSSPTLLMQADPSMGGVLSDEQAQRARHLLSNGSLLKFPGAGHAIHAFGPKEFVEAIVHFVDADPDSVS